MSGKKERGQWMGHPVLDKEHAHKLHLQAAIYEFQHGLPREEAEKRALDEYRQEHHARAAAHHLSGMKAAVAVGNHEDAEKHHDLYSLHVKALGLNPMDAVAPEVQKYRDPSSDKEFKHVYGFKGHDADDYLVKPVQGGIPPVQAQAALAQQQAAQQPMQKAEGDGKCSNCGTPHGPDQGDCYECGQAVNYTPTGIRCDDCGDDTGYCGWRRDVRRREREKKGQPAQKPGSFGTVADILRDKAQRAGVDAAKFPVGQRGPTGVQYGVIEGVDGGGETTPARAGHLRVVKGESLPQTEVVLEKDVKDVTARLRKHLDQRKAIADLLARVEKLKR